MTAGATPSQTVGPFFSFGLCVRPQHELVDPGHPLAVRLGGHVYDGAGEPVPDAMVELWHPPYGWGRSGTDAAGAYGFVTGALADAAAPYASLQVFARGLMRQVHTRVYVADDPRATSDPLLAALTAEERAALTGVAAGPGEIRFDIHLQGEHETVFFDV